TLTHRRGKQIGSRFSAREEASRPWEHDGQDQIAILDEMKIIEKRLLKAAEDFLDARNVDTSVFKQQVLNIINSGVLNMGRLDIGQAAVGAGAQIHNTNANSGEQAASRHQGTSR